MRQRSERRQGMLAVLTGISLGMASLAAAPAQPEADDERLASAIAHQRDGHPERALAVLLPAAEAGDRIAMERLALLHWYGGSLYKSTSFSRELGRYWFQRAAQQGSELGRHMLSPLRPTLGSR